MLKKSLKLFSLILTTVMILSLSVPSFAQSSDYSNSWAAVQIAKWMDSGVFIGNPDGSFKPQASITRAEFATVLTRLYGLKNKGSSTYSDVKGAAWYADAVSMVTEAGLMKGDGINFRPGDPISRQEAAVVFARGLNLKAKDLKVLDKFADSGKIASWSRDAFAASVENGYISGRSADTAAPEGNITRAETAKLIDNTAGILLNKAGTYSESTAKNLVINTGSVILKNMTVNGDLLLAQGIGEGDVTLENVLVKGRTIVRGGGENSIVLNNTSLQGTLLVIKQDGKVRIVAKGSTDVTSVELNSGARLQEQGSTGAGFGGIQVTEIKPGQEIRLDGDFDEVVVSAEDADVQVTSGSVTKMEVSSAATNAKITVSDGAKVGDLTANSAADIRVNSGAVVTNLKANAAASIAVADGSKITTLTADAAANIQAAKGSEITTINANAAATVVLAEGSKVTTLTANAAVNVSGKGEIAKAEIKAPGVKIEQTPAVVTVLYQAGSAEVGGKNVSATEPPPQGQGGGGDTPSAISISNPYIAVDTGNVSGSVSGNTASVSLSTKGAGDQVSSVNFTTNATSSTLLVSTISSVSAGTITLNKTLTFNTANVSIDAEDLLAGLGSTNISMATLRALLGSSVAVTGTLTGTGGYSSYTPATVTVNITLGGGAMLTAANYFSGTTRSGTTVSATIKIGAGGTLIRDIVGNITGIITTVAGSVPSYVSFDGGSSWLEIDSVNFVQDSKVGLAAEFGKLWTSITLEDLKTHPVKFKKGIADPTVYTVNFN